MNRFLSHGFECPSRFIRHFKGGTEECNHTTVARNGQSVTRCGNLTAPESSSSVMQVFDIRIITVYNYRTIVQVFDSIMMYNGYIVVELWLTMLMTEL